jgi:Transposase DDE domain
VDKIYRTKDNRAWCQERGIRISGPQLGRPLKNVSKEKKRNKPWKMKEFVIVLRGNLDKVKEDLAWAESWQN